MWDISSRRLQKQWDHTQRKKNTSEVGAQKKNSRRKSGEEMLVREDNERKSEKLRRDRETEKRARSTAREPVFVCPLTNEKKEKKTH